MDAHNTMDAQSNTYTLDRLLWFFCIIVSSSISTYSTFFSTRRMIYSLVAPILWFFISFWLRFWFWFWCWCCCCCCCCCCDDFVFYENFNSSSSVKKSRYNKDEWEKRQVVWLMRDDERRSETFKNSNVPFLSSRAKLQTKNTFSTHKIWNR